LNSDISWSTGPFTNTGPLPPVAEKATTYTIHWSLVNSSNKIEGAEVRASIPLYVTFLNNIYPSGESVSFDSQSGEILWNIGSIPAGIGLTGPAKEVSFQVSLLPSVTQVGDAPTIISESVLRGLDTFTRVTLEDRTPSLSTILLQDPLFSSDFTDKTRVVAE